MGDRRHIPRDREDDKLRLCDSDDTWNLMSMYACIVGKRWNGFDVLPRTWLLALLGVL
ncbi:hypothetical protein LINGRAHAP2_LOCUS28746 [Linum grandiflorum]